MWPVTKAVPKELLPLGSAPAILHLADELVTAGFTRLIFVVGDRPEPLVQLFNPRIAAPEKVRDRYWVRRLTEIADQVEIVFVQQRGPYGNGTPLRCAYPLVGGEPCLYCFSDDIIFGENITGSLIASYMGDGHPAAGVQRVEDDRVHLFGILECAPGSSLVKRVLEKPAASETEGRLATFGRYIVTPELMAVLNRIGVGRAGELWFSDAMARFVADGGTLHAIALSSGQWHTTGDPEGYAKAFQVAMQEERLRA